MFAAAVATAGSRFRGRTMAPGYCLYGRHEAEDEEEKVALYQQEVNARTAVINETALAFIQCFFFLFYDGGKVYCT